MNSLPTYQEITDQWHALGAGARLIVSSLGVLLPVIVVMLVWALFRRKKHRRRHSRASLWGHPKPHESVAARNGIAPGGHGGSRHHRRHKKRVNRPRNPTLAETGGLPKRSDLPPGTLP